MTAPRFLDAGECALVVEFGDRIDAALTARVLALDAALAVAPVPGVSECVPTYRSLMVHYDPLTLTRDALVAAVTAALPRTEAPPAPRRQWRIPACYDAALAEDLPHVAAACGLTPDAVVALHAGATYRVVMYGFAPGWMYLNGLPAALALPRRSAPRDRIPGGSLIVAGGQAIVAGGPMPSGWHIIGRTPFRSFDAARTPSLPVDAGDAIAFDPVDLATFHALDARAAAGEPILRAGA